MGAPPALLRPVEDPAGLPRSKERFCAFVYFNPGCERRNEFFRVLLSKKHPDSACRLLNNIGGGLSDRNTAGAGAFSDLLGFCSRHKFAVAFKNSSSPGYTTEKIAAPLLGGCTPIYWGNPDIAEESGPEAFINTHDFGSMKELAGHVLKTDAHDDLYLRCLLAPRFADGKLPDDAGPGITHGSLGAHLLPEGRAGLGEGVCLQACHPSEAIFVQRQAEKARKRKLHRPPTAMRNPTIDLSGRAGD